MILSWVVAAAACVAAVLAWVQARRTARRLDQLVQMYWELKYQHGELRAELRQLTGGTPQPARAPGHPAPGTNDRPVLSRVEGAGADGVFIPLTSLRR